MMLRFNAELIGKRVGNLPKEYRIVFAACCAERLVPNYRVFVNAEEWGDRRLLDDALTCVWQFVEGSAVTADRIQQFISDVATITPDSEDFSGFLTSLAIDAAASVCYALRCCLDGAPIHSVHAAAVSINSLDAYLCAVNDPETGTHAFSGLLGSWVQDSPMMQDELQQQESDLQLLESQPELTQATLAALQEMMRSKGIQLMARGLIRMSRQ